MEEEEPDVVDVFHPDAGQLPWLSQPEVDLLYSQCQAIRGELEYAKAIFPDGDFDPIPQALSCMETELGSLSASVGRREDPFPGSISIWSQAIYATEQVLHRQLNERIRCLQGTLSTIIKGLQNLESWDKDTLIHRLNLRHEEDEHKYLQLQTVSKEQRRAHANQKSKDTQVQKMAAEKAQNYQSKLEADIKRLTKKLQASKDEISRLTKHVGLFTTNISILELQAAHNLSRMKTYEEQSGNALKDQVEEAHELLSKNLSLSCDIDRLSKDNESMQTKSMQTIQELNTQKDSLSRQIDMLENRNMNVRGQHTQIVDDLKSEMKCIEEQQKQTEEQMALLKLHNRAWKGRLRKKDAENALLMKERENANQEIHAQIEGMRRSAISWATQWLHNSTQSDLTAALEETTTSLPHPARPRNPVASSNSLTQGYTFSPQPPTDEQIDQLTSYSGLYESMLAAVPQDSTVVKPHFRLLKKTAAVSRFNDQSDRSSTDDDDVTKS